MDSLFRFLAAVPLGNNSCMTLLNIVRAANFSCDLEPIKALITEYIHYGHQEIEDLIKTTYLPISDESSDDYDEDVEVLPCITKPKPTPVGIGKKRPRPHDSEPATPFTNAMATTAPTIKIDETVEEPRELSGILFLPAKLVESATHTDDADVTP